MPHVTSIERLAREEGLEEGRQEGLKQGQRAGIEKGRQATLQENILDVLEARFGTVPHELQELIKAVRDEHKLEQLHRGAVLCASLAEFDSSLKSSGNTPSGNAP